MKKTREEKRELILEYINSPKVLSVNPLKFHHYESPLEVHRTDITAMVKRCLCLSKTYGSVDAITGVYETDLNKYRSSLDIWRHIVYFYPDVTIFQVMSAISLYRKNLYGQYCTEVHRRVFKLREEYQLAWFKLQDVYTADEYGLKMSEWTYL